VFLPTFSDKIIVYGPNSSSAFDSLPAGAYLSAAFQDPNQNQISVMAVDKNGALWVFWEKNNQPWTRGNQAKLSANGLFPPGAPVTLGWEPDNSHLDAFLVGNDGGVYWTSDVIPQAWTPLQRIPNTSTFPRGAKIATIQQGTSTMDAFVVGND